MISKSILHWNSMTGFLLAGLLGASTLSAAPTGEDWLQKMSKAVEVSNYRGTIARSYGGKVEYLKVVHKYENGQVTEKLETMDGASRTIIRDANGVRCFLPESKAVLVEASSTDTGLFSRIPVSMERLREQYDVLLFPSKIRIADRQSVLVEIRPRDGLRYRHRLWLAEPSGLPLKTEMIDEFGKAIEQVRFVDLNLDAAIPSSEFDLNIDTQGFRFIRQGPSSVKPIQSAQSVSDARWQAGQLPPGFSLSYSNGAESKARHLIFDDGLASVSVFIEPPKPSTPQISGHSTLGGSNAYSAVVQGYQITAVGEVPRRTVRLIARSLSMQATDAP